MPSKAVIALAAAAAFALAGCAAARKPPTPVPPTPAPQPEPAPQAQPEIHAPAHPAATPVPARRAPQPPPRPKAPAAAPAPTPRQPALPSLIEGKTTWVDYGRSLVVARDSTPGVPPVPLFRQAIVLASVRAAVAGSPAAPKAEFRRGLLTLTFPGGTTQEIAAAVNRAIAVPEVSKLGVQLGD